MHRINEFRYIFFSIALGLSLASCAPVDDTADRSAALSAQYVEESGLSGIAISVAIGGEITWSEGFGFADVEQNVTVDSALTKFRVGSTAKSMTAMALGQLHEAGKLDLDKPIQAYLPEFPEKEGTITTRMLAGHLAGIRHYASDEEFLSAVPYASITNALTIFSDDPLLFLPGTEFSYSTYGYNLISAVVERAADQEFLSYMSDNV